MKFTLPADYKLPVFPKIIRECLVYLYKPDADTSLLAKSLSQDIGVSANILKMANSSYFLLGKGAPTSDLKTAIMRIGHENLRQIMLLNALESTVYFQDIEFFIFKSFCRHASFTGIICSELSKKAAPNFVADMQMAGLMHDVGLSIMASIFPKDMARLIEYCKKHETDFYDSENKLGIESHQQLGVRVLQTWDIPTSVIKVIENHHIRLPENRKNLPQEYQILTDIFVLADILAHSYSYGFKNYKRDTKIELSLLKRIGLTADEIKETLKTCLEIANSMNS